MYTYITYKLEVTLPSGYKYRQPKDYISPKKAIAAYQSRPYSERIENELLKGYKFYIIKIIHKVEEESTSLENLIIFNENEKGKH